MCGGFFGFREKEKRGKNMGRSEEGKNVGARGETPDIAFSIKCAGSLAVPRMPVVGLWFAKM